MVYITRKEHFNAAHKLYNANWSEEKNQMVFGKCANHNSHGHNYELFVTVKGKPDKETGFVIDAKKLGSIIQEKIAKRLDHKNLNEQVSFLEGIQPTTENLAIAIFKELEPFIGQGTLHSVRLHETDKIYAEYFGE